MTVREMLNSASDDAIASAILRGAFKKCAYCIYDDAVIRQIKRCRFHQIKTGLSEHLTMG